MIIINGKYPRVKDNCIVLMIDCYSKFTIILESRITYAEHYMIRMTLDHYPQIGDNNSELILYYYLNCPIILESRISVSN
jgi:hypothetical protein